ncbi:MAG: radical SAM protein [Myxococcales bacterium]|nr:radical SAM protein [Myxococcales bacterium]MCB9700522.1 radical SAM protein [Myxococcales bacterium]
MKVSEFNLLCPSFVDGVYLAYNTLSGAFLTLDAADFELTALILEAVAAGDPITGFEPRLVVALRRGGFLVNAAVDERAEVRRRYREGRARTRGVSLTIAPTLSCNFACTYCFQEHPKRHMGDAEIDRIVRHVEANLEPETALSITWFGGEPLMAYPVIKALSTRLRAHCEAIGASYSHSMITNGSLLGDGRIDDLVALGGFRYLQVTLDGPPEVHDRRRLSVVGGPTFDRILANVARASERLRIILRVNVDRSNADRLEGLVDRLVDLDLQRRVSVYLGHTLPYTDVCAGVGDVALSREEFAALQTRFKFYLLTRGFRGVSGLPRPRAGGICVADHPGGAVLAPDDLVFRCWNEVAMTDEHASGRLDGEASASMLANNAGWDSFDPFFHTPCKTCRVQPLCTGGCPWESRKQGPEETGDCTPLRFNLADELRIYHLERSIHRSLPEAFEESELPCQ